MVTQTENKKKKKTISIINHIIVILMFVMISFFAPVDERNCDSVIKLNTAEAEYEVSGERTLIIAVYGCIEDDRYFTIDYVGSLLRGLDLPKTDTILINTNLSMAEQNDIFDEAMLEYLVNNYKYTNIIALGDDSMEFAEEAKHLFYPSASLYCCTIKDCNSTITEDAFDTKYLANKSLGIRIDNDSHVYTCSDDEFVSATIKSALEMNKEEENIIIVKDDSDYCSRIVSLIFKNSLLADKQIKVVDTKDFDINTFDYNTIFLFTAFPDNIDEIMTSLSRYTLANCFDLSDEDINHYTQSCMPMRFVSLVCNHEPIVLLGEKSDLPEYMAHDLLEKTLLCYIGLDKDGFLAYEISDLNTAKFINYGLMLNGITSFSDNVIEQAKICVEKDLVISKSQLKVGDVIYLSDTQYPDEAQVKDVAVYLGSNTVIHVNEDGLVVCEESPEDIYHSIYADIRPLFAR